MATAFVPSYEAGQDGTVLECRVMFHGPDLQANPTGANVIVVGVDFTNDNPSQIAAKVATAVRTLAGQIRNNTGAAGVTIPANAVIMPGMTKG